MERRLQLQPRLQLLADMVPEGCRLADVGTDHGYLPVYLLQRRRIRGAVAADIGAPDEVDTVVIAGMGGETIIAILEGAAWTKDGAHTLLLQPMTKAADLRYWLAVNGYRFTEERLVWDKNYLYPVLRVTGGGTPQALTERQALTGVALDNDPLYREYLTQQADKLRRTAEGLRRSAKPDAQQRADAAEALAREIEEKRDTL